MLSALINRILFAGFNDAAEGVCEKYPLLRIADGVRNQRPCSASPYADFENVTRYLN